MKIVNLTRGTLLADKIFVADTPFSRIKGLLGKDKLNENEALILSPCNSIHTFFMRFAIDVIFLDKQNKVVALKENMFAFRFTPIYLKAHCAVELSAFKITHSLTQLNDLIQIEK